MEIPEGEKPTVYETRFILQKMEWRKEFTLENYPDSTWTLWIQNDGEGTRIRTALFMTFSIIRQEDGEDINHEVLDDDNYTFFCWWRIS